MADAGVARLEGRVGAVEIDFVDSLGIGRRLSLSSCVDVRFEDALPVRSFRWSPGLGHFSGWWWAATVGRHVGYESWLERDHVRAMDFDREIVGIASQPFWLRWEGDGGHRRHAPDYFVRRSDGVGVVVDVRADDRIAEKDADTFAVTAQICGVLGWEFRRLGEIESVLRSNVRWLARYRHPRCAGGADVEGRLREVFSAPVGLFAGAEAVGDRLAVLPALFHLMWRQELVADLTQARLGPATRVRTAGAPVGSR